MHTACGRNRSDFKMLTAKATGKRFLGRSRHIWEDNINYLNEH